MLLLIEHGVLNLGSVWFLSVFRLGITGILACLAIVLNIVRKVLLKPLRLCNLYRYAALTDTGEWPSVT